MKRQGIISGLTVIDKIAEKLNITLDQAKFKGIYGIGHVEGEKVYLLKPLTYMNLSGESISSTNGLLSNRCRGLIGYL